MARGREPRLFRVPAALESLLADLPSDGSFSLWAGPVRGDAVTAHRAAEQHYAASTMKLALVMAAYREAAAGRLDLDALVAVHDGFPSAADGSPFRMDAADDGDAEPWRRLGTSVALRWLCLRALVRSSNLATNLVLERVGAEPVQRLLADVGAASSRVTRGIEDTAARAAGLDNLVTAADLARTLQALANAEVLDAPDSAEVLSVLRAVQINDALPAGLPAGTRVAHKSGWVTGVSHDAGIVYPEDAPPFVLAVCTTSDLEEQAGLALVAAAAAAAWSDRKVLG